MPTKPKDTDKITGKQPDPTSAEVPGDHWRTGPNVDAGIEPGAVTVDPETAEGRAAREARKANGATSSVNDDGVEVVDQPDAPYGPKVEEKDDQRVLEHENHIKEKQLL